jgi:hypothetical protein
MAARDLRLQCIGQRDPRVFEGLAARRAVRNRIGRADSLAKDLRRKLRETFVANRRRPLESCNAGLLGEGLDRVDRGLHLLVPQRDGAEHDVLRQELRFRFDHQHGLGRAGDDEVELGLP